MNTRKKVFLLPYGFQVAGWIIAGISALVMVCGLLFSDKETLQNGFYVVGEGFLYLGVFLIGLSREKLEDEFTLFLRTRSALTSVVIMFGLNILLAIVFVSLAGLPSIMRRSMIMYL